MSSDLYHKGELVAAHDVRAQGTVNYHLSHYESGLAGKLASDDEIAKLAARNLAKFKDMGE